MGYSPEDAFSALQDVKRGKQPSINKVEEPKGFVADVKRAAEERVRKAGDVTAGQTGAERFFQEAGQ